MRTFFTEIALVNTAARLLGITLMDNYAVFGAMPRYRHLSLGEIVQADGIDDVPQKAESFRFGAHCGQILEKYDRDWDDRAFLIYDAQVARVFFAPLYQAPEFTEAQKRETLLTIISALVKRAQIRTHTAKPGYEDIDVWLERYYWMQKEYRDHLPRMVDAIIAPDEASLLRAERFLSAKDRLVSLALSDKPFTGEQLQQEMEQEPASLFGRMLRETLATWKR